VRSDGPTPVVLQLRAHRAGVPVVAGPDRWASPPGDVSGLAIGSGTVRGPACVLDGPDEMDRLVPGGVLVTASTDPAWLPLLGGLGAVVTDHGGLTSHAAIVCRELGILAVVGCGDATRRLVHGHQVEVRCDGPNGTVSAIS
jgi:pyruvate,water dikinase